MTEVETVTIPVIEYETLKTSARLLAALEAGGVDNWDGWDDALDRAEANS